MINTNWEQWNDKHSNSEQIKRQNSACKKNLTPLEVNQTNCTGTFKGSNSNYLTTLSDCQCRDFILRKLPCKHMYRLAYELQVFDLPSEVLRITSTDSPQLNKKEAMQIIMNILTPDEQKEFGYFCYHCGNNNASEELFSASMSERLLNAKLACEVTDVEKLLKHLHIAEVRKFLPAGTKGPRKKTELIAFVAPLVTKDDIIFPEGKKCLTLHPCVAHLGHTIHRQICTLYPDATHNSFFDM